ncbi:hypothetical protein Q5O12_28215, partial [Klebsiella pneumoniae]|uniref:hypothetical protein n=1 Tax=Klebsiella pneumoniae TaxID=573 RepID=UPI002732032C
LIAKLYPEVDLVLGGHTHHVLAKGELDGRTLLAAAGKYGYYIGHVKLEIDPAAKIIMFNLGRFSGRFLEVPGR